MFSIFPFFPTIFFLVFVVLCFVYRKAGLKIISILICCSIISLLFIPFLGFFIILPPAYGQIIDVVNNKTVSGVSVSRMIHVEYPSLHNSLSSGGIPYYRKDYRTISNKKGLFVFGPRILLSQPCLLFTLKCPYIGKDLIRPNDNNSYFVDEKSFSESALSYETELYPPWDTKTRELPRRDMSFINSQFINNLRVVPKNTNLQNCNENQSCLNLNSFGIAVIKRDLNLCSDLTSVDKKYCNELIAYQKVDTNAIKSTEGWNKWMDEVNKVQDYSYCEGILNETNHNICERIVVDGKRLIEHTKMLDTLYGTSYEPLGVCNMQIVCLNEKTGQYDQCPEKLKIAKQEELEGLKKRWPEFTNEIVCK